MTSPGEKGHLTELEWGADGVPTEDSIRHASRDTLAAWVRARAAGLDGHWSDRQGDSPEDLLRALIRNGSPDVSTIIGLALADVIKVELKSDGVFPVLKTLLALATVCGESWSFATSSLIRSLEHALESVRPETPADRIRALLLTRAALRGRIDRRLWEPHLANRDLAVAAFRCAFTASKDAACEAFARLVELSAVEPLPFLQSQASLLAREWGWGVVERTKEQVELKMKAARAADAQADMGSGEPAVLNTTSKIAAFLSLVTRPC